MCVKANLRREPDYDGAMPKLCCFVTFLLFSLVGPSVFAHIDDEARQAFATIKISENEVEVITTIPARYAFPVMFDGASPIEMDKLEPDEMAKQLEPILAERNPVKIDGIVVRPKIMGTVVEMTNSRLPARSFIEPQVMQYGQLIYVALYELKTPPRRVTINWDVFVPEYDETGKPVEDGETSPVVAVVKVDDKSQMQVLTADEPSYTWHSADSVGVPEDLLIARQVDNNVMRVPVLSLVILLVAGVLSFGVYRKSHGGGVASALCGLMLGVVLLPYGTLDLPQTSSYAKPSEDEAIELFRALHANIYRAFDYSDEGAIYDALAQSVDGPMLETIYNDVYQSLIMRDEGGAVSKVQKVDVQSAELIDHFDTASKTPPDEEAGSFIVRASWTVDGLVQHFGHTHSRTNAFEALYTVAPRAGGWRIVEAQILEQQRIDDGKQGL